MKKNILLLIVSLLSIGQIGCSINPHRITLPQTAKAPTIEKVNIVGMSRNEFLNKFHPPVVSRLVGDKRVDTITSYKINNKPKAYGVVLYNVLIANTIVSSIHSVMPSKLPLDSVDETLLIPDSVISREKIVIAITYNSSDYIEKVERIE
ncbi:hypothetical protein [Acinetobacter nosocomialis]|uniref:hypothetical protein n=1 Tax=Acinetobacter nosocomialis TaxID=106654 RepID=UPI00124C4D0B|nr:hypothetical protein [Acinetobacter nosocomialis]MCU4553400.1 hypothetical protein [Acinetobacter nosocomialis]MDO7539706.1 hypothetical protein [Acinetobacter nosocomialis]MDX7880859.1 hypothetical protein [Acinetobacter nosocomialis]